MGDCGVDGTTRQNWVMVRDVVVVIKNKSELLFSKLRFHEVNVVF